MSPDPAVLAGASCAHRHLEATLALVDEAVARRPSRLPDWSVAHVLAHLSLQAQSQQRALAGARVGEVVDRYPGGTDERAAEIELTARRPASELVAAVRDTAQALEADWASTEERAWERPGLSLGRPEPIGSLPFRRWREVEVHHADLGLGYSFEDWPSGYVRRDLANAAMAWRARMPMGQTDLPAAALALAPARRLAWLLGRVQVEGLPAVAQWW